MRPKNKTRAQNGAREGTAGRRYVQNHLINGYIEVRMIDTRGKVIYVALAYAHNNISHFLATGRVVSKYASSTTERAIQRKNMEHTRHALRS